jgi:hypothetical protein
MRIVEQTASIVWEGSIARGRGEINGGSGAIAGVPTCVVTKALRGNVEISAYATLEQATSSEPAA